MTKDLGVWTADDCALVLIDYQKEMFEVIRSETDADLVELHVRLLAKTAKAFDMPIVLSTVGVGFGFNGPTLPSVLSELDGIEPIDRSSMNAFEDQAFRDAVKATGRKRLIIGGLHTEICLTFATVQALKDGYDVLYVDRRRRRTVRRSHTAPASSGWRTPARFRRRRSRSSPSSSATGRGRSPAPALDVIYWYFSEVPKLTDQVGVAEAEKLAAAAHERALRCRAGWLGRSASSRARAGAWVAPPP